MEKAECRNCKYYMATVGSLGECRLYPPSIVTGVIKGKNELMPKALLDSTKFPTVMGDCWCGQFKEQAHW